MVRYGRRRSLSVGVYQWPDWKARTTRHSYEFAAD